MVGNNATKAGTTRTAQLVELLEKQAVLTELLLKGLNGEAVRSSIGLELRQSSDSRAHIVERVLNGNDDARHGLAYNFSDSHIAAIIQGQTAKCLAKLIATEVKTQTLSVAVNESTVWLWISNPNSYEFRELIDAQSCQNHASPILAIGEHAQGLEGWRRTIKQARAVLPVAATKSSHSIWYRDSALDAALLDNELLVDSLSHRFVNPFLELPDKGQTLFETLRAYFSASMNSSSAAAALKVDRRTIQNRLRRVEAFIGESPMKENVELQLAVKIYDLFSPRKEGSVP